MKSLLRNEARFMKLISLHNIDKEMKYVLKLVADRKRLIYILGF